MRQMYIFKTTKKIKKELEPIFKLKVHIIGVFVKMLETR